MTGFQPHCRRVLVTGTGVYYYYVLASAHSTPASAAGAGLAHSCGTEPVAGKRTETLEVATDAGKAFFADFTKTYGLNNAPVYRKAQLCDELLWSNSQRSRYSRLGITLGLGHRA